MENPWSQTRLLEIILVAKLGDLGGGTLKR